MRCVERFLLTTSGLIVRGKNDDYDEDEGIYDDLNLDEEEEKFGRLITEDHDSDGSDNASEGVFSCIKFYMTIKPSDPAADLHSRNASKKHDEESMASSKREESSPILKKAGAALQLRSMYPPDMLLLSNSSFSPTFIEHSTAGEGLPLHSRSFFTYRSHDAIPSTKTSAKSKFCTTAHVEYTQSRSPASTTTTTIEIRNGGCRGSDSFSQPTKQCVSIIIGTNTDNPPCAHTRARICTPAIETRAGSIDNIAGSHCSRNFISELDTDLHVKPVSVFNIGISTATGRLVWLTVTVRSRIAS